MGLFDSIRPTLACRGRSMTHGPPSHEFEFNAEGPAATS